jgi:hypothetical protein
MYALVAIQVAFCFIVHFAKALFVATFDRLANQPTGFSAERILNLEALTHRPPPPAFWDQVAEHLRAVPGVETVALAGWPLMSAGRDGRDEDSAHRRQRLSRERHQSHCRDRQRGFRERGTFIVRTSSPNPLTLAQILRQEVPRARPEFRVSRIRTQTEIKQLQTVRERLLAMLALFFAVVALLLAGVGLYGVLDYSVPQRRREIGIRMAIGAQAGDIARRVTVDVFTMVLVGAFAGLALGMVSVRYIETLLYQVKATDLGVLALPSLTILAAALLAALPAVIRAVRIDPVKMLRAE